MFKFPYNTLVLKLHIASQNAFGVIPDASFNQNLCWNVQASGPGVEPLTTAFIFFLSVCISSCRYSTTSVQRLLSVFLFQVKQWLSQEVVLIFLSRLKKTVLKCILHTSGQNLLVFSGEIIAIGMFDFVGYANFNQRVIKTQNKELRNKLKLLNSNKILPYTGTTVYLHCSSCGKNAIAKVEQLQSDPQQPVGRSLNKMFAKIIIIRVEAMYV